MPQDHLLDDVRWGLLAVQTGLIPAETLLEQARRARAAAMPLDRTLLAAGLLTPADHQRLQDLSATQTVYEPAGGLESLGGLALSLHAALSDSGTATRPIAADEDSTATMAPESSSFPADPLATLAPENDATLPPDEDATLLPDADPTAAGPSGRAGGPSAGATGSRFRIVRMHARGGLGQVSLAEDLELRRDVALKEIQPQFADDADARSRFVREAEITGRLEHPGIVPVYGLCRDRFGRPYYAMRFIEGRSMKESVEAYHQARLANDPETTLKLRELLRRFVDVCNAVEYAHSRGILHRDLKPANVMLGPYGETLVVDWGLAKPMAEAESDRAAPAEGTPAAPTQRPASIASVSSLGTMDGSALGTPQYMSPEQAAGRWSEVGPAADIYSLGATLYHILAGQPAFIAKTITELLTKVQQGEFLKPRAVLPTIPAPLESICLKAMSARAQDRYPTAREMAVEIEHWMGDEKVACHHDGRMERIYRWMRKHRAWTQGVATMVPLLLIIATIAGLLIERARRDAVKQKDTAVLARLAEQTQRELAQANEKRAEQEEQKAVRSAEEARRTLANLLTANGDRAQAEGDHSAAALWFSRALPVLAGRDPEAERMQRIRLALVLAQLPRPVNVWPVPDVIRQLLFRPILSDDGQRVLFIGASGEVAGVDASTGRELWPRLKHEDLVIWCGFSPDNRLIATVSPPRVFRIWDAETGEPVTPALESSVELPWNSFGPDGKVEFNADNSLISVVGGKEPSRTVEVWDVAKGERRFPPLVFEDALAAVRFSPIGNRLLVGTKTHLHYYDLATGQPATEPVPVVGLWSARYSRDGRWLVTTTGEGQARIWDTATGEPVGTPLTHAGPVTEAVFNDAGTQLVTLSSDRTARLWEVPTGKAVGSTLEHGDRPLSAQYHQEGALLTTVSIEYTVRLWDTATGRLLGSPWRHPSTAAAAFSGPLVRIIADGRGADWDLSRITEPGAVRISGAESIMALDFLPQGGGLLAVGGEAIWILDPLTGNLRLGPVRHGATITALATTPDGQRLASGGEDGTIQFWNAADGTPQGPRLKHAGPITQLQFNMKGERLISCSLDQTARIWDAATGLPIGEPLQHTAAVRDAAFSPDGDWVVTGSDDHTMRIWRASDGQPYTEPKYLRNPQSGQAVTRVRFHPAGQTVLGASDSGEIVLWEPFVAASKLRRFRLDGAVSMADFSPDGQRIIAAGFVNLVKVWDWQQAEAPSLNLASGFMSLQGRFHPSSEIAATVSFGGMRLWALDGAGPLGPTLWPMPKSTAFSPDGLWLASVDKQIRLWNLAPLPGTPEEIDLLVRLLATREIDTHGALQFLNHSQLPAAWESARTQWPAELAPAPGRTVSLPAAP